MATGPTTAGARGEAAASSCTRAARLGSRSRTPSRLCRQRISDFGYNFDSGGHRRASVERLKLDVARRLGGHAARLALDHRPAQEYMRSALSFPFLRWPGIRSRASRRRLRTVPRCPAQDCFCHWRRSVCASGSTATALDGQWRSEGWKRRCQQTDQTGRAWSPSRLVVVEPH
mgnify:CR=1 FL=1